LLDSLEPSYKRKVQAIINLQISDAASLVEAGVLTGLDQSVNAKRRTMVDMWEKQYRRVLTVFSNLVFSELEGSAKAGLVDFEVKTPVDSFWQAAGPWVSTHAAKKVTMVNETTKRLIRREIDDGMSTGISHRDIAKNIKAKGLISTKWRALKIARTETHQTAMFGSFKSAEATKLIKEKEWDTARDERVRKNHAMADTERVKLQEYFIMTGERLMFPGDPGGSGWNIINCRCAVNYHTRTVRKPKPPKKPPVTPPKPLPPKPLPPKPKPKPKPKPIPKPKPKPKPPAGDLYKPVGWQKFPGISTAKPGEMVWVEAKTAQEASTQFRLLTGFRRMVNSNMNGELGLRWMNRVGEELTGILNENPNLNRWLRKKLNSALDHQRGQQFFVHQGALPNVTSTTTGYFSSGDIYIKVGPGAEQMSSTSLKIASGLHHSTNGMSRTIIHEFGHHIQSQLTNTTGNHMYFGGEFVKSWRRLYNKLGGNKPGQHGIDSSSQWFKKNLDTYSGKTYPQYGSQHADHEAFAQSLSAWTHPQYTPGKAHQTLYSEIETLLESTFGVNPNHVKRSVRPKGMI